MELNYHQPDMKISSWIKKYYIIDHNELASGSENNLTLSPLTGNCWIFIISDFGGENGAEHSCYYLTINNFYKKIEKFDFKYITIFRIICIQFEQGISLKKAFCQKSQAVIENFKQNLKLEITGNEIANKLNSVFHHYKIDKTFKQNIAKQIIDLLRKNPSLKINDISKSLYLCSRQLNRIFQDEIGCSIKAYQKYLRINESLHLILMSNNTNLSDVIYSLGYFDHNHFLKDFKSFYGDMPSLFKKINTVCLNEIFFVTALQKEISIN